MSVLIKGGTIVTATDLYTGDVYVEGERITTIGTALDLPADRVIDATGKLVLPGGIDVHTHLDMPFGGTTSADDFESGTIAAAFGIGTPQAERTVGVMSICAAGVSTFRPSGKCPFQRA